MISVCLQCVQTGAERDGGLADCSSTADMRRLPYLTPDIYPRRISPDMRRQWISGDISCDVSRYPEISVEHLLISTDIY